MHKVISRVVGVAVLALLTSCTLPVGGSGHPGATPTPTPTATVSPTPTVTPEEADAQSAANNWLRTGQDDVTQANSFYGTNGVPFASGTVAVLPIADGRTLYLFINLRYDGYIYSNTNESLFLFQTRIQNGGRAVVVVQSGTIWGSNHTTTLTLSSLNPYTERGSTGGGANPPAPIEQVVKNILVGEHVNMSFGIGTTTSNILLGKIPNTDTSGIVDKTGVLMSRQTSDMSVPGGSMLYLGQ